MSSTTDSASDLPEQPTTVRDAAQQYTARGWAVTPLVPNAKSPKLEGWLTTRITSETIDQHFDPEDGIGVLLGKQSNGLTDVDIDSALGLRVARHPDMLPTTGLGAERDVKPKSHRLYSVEGEIRNRAFTSAATGKNIIEILSDGKQMAAPPGRVAGGDQKRWFAFGEPGRVSAGDLERYVAELAVTAELVQVWPAKGNGVRHAAYLALAGGLLNAGVEPSRIEAIAEVVIAETGDDEPDDRRRAVLDTLAKEDAGPLTGWPRLAELSDARKSIDRILDWLGVTGVDLDDTRPGVRVTDGDLNQLTENAWLAFAEANNPPTVFRRLNEPVRVERIDGGSKVKIVALSEAMLRHHAAEAVRWYTVKNDRKGRPVQHATFPPKDVIANMLAAPDIPLPVLDRVVTAPVFARDGTLQTEPGYHPAARVYYTPEPAFAVSPVPAEPTTQQLDAARALLLDDLLGEFPFATQSDRAHAVAALLVPFVRELIQGSTPLHFYEAAIQGTGKGLLARVSSMIFAGGRGAPETPWNQKEAEMGKAIFALLYEGAPYVFLDNIVGKFDSTALAVGLTSGTFSDRILGLSKMASIEARCIWIATANNAVMGGDMPRRTLRIRIVRDEENPHLWRPRRHANLEEWTRENRPRLVEAALTLIQHWVAQGMPKVTLANRLGSFESWSDVMGSVLHSAGIPGFLDNIRDFYAEASPVGDSIAGFVRLWWEEYGPAPVTASTLLPLAVIAGVDLGYGDESRQKQRFGSMLASMRDQVHDGFRIPAGVRASRGGNTYALQPMRGQEWTPPTREPSNVSPIKPGTADDMFETG